ncbi:hypothetical protein [Mycolicibacterium komossense]|uniref:Uncharacterized protein n=1 Tax=Mycolicibacterium komossense TaxID=1779 RepID=A0ABT3C9H1_9MYCO|nr:hypothetical protein [Mycolicibacterium komossense]MCV7226061.1 hypothetical protein [Mycolicibacterium komossense]
MGRLKIPISDDRKIRRVTVRPACRQVAATIAVVAGRIAGDPNGYGVEETVGTDRARENVFAKSGEAAHKEAGAAPPLQQAAMRVKK